MLTVDKPVQLADAEIAATIFGLNGGPVMLGDDIDRMDASRLDLVRQILPRLPEAARPLDLFDTPAPDYPKLFHLRAKTAWGEWDLLACFNYGKDALRQAAEFARLDPGSPGPRAVWDHWAARYIGARAGRFEAVVPPQSVKLWRISRVREHPWILSTDMHVRQGQTEVEDCRWDAASHTLTVRVRRPAGNRGNVYLTVPTGMALEDPSGPWIAKDANDGTLVVRRAFDFRDGSTVERRIRFRP